MVSEYEEVLKMLTSIIQTPEKFCNWFSLYSILNILLFLYILFSIYSLLLQNSKFLWKQLNKKMRIKLIWKKQQ
jgi:hypothetical protein